MSDSDDDIPHLSESTLQALQEFLQDQSKQSETDIQENWQLSQFWYDENTIQHLSNAAFSLCDKNSKIALISCPSLFKTIKGLTETSKNNAVHVKLFEFDKRFSCFSPDFVFYNYNEPLAIDPAYKNYFDVIVVDPPFLSDECLGKTAQSVLFMGTVDCKIILCTGAVMEARAEEILKVRKCSFQPMHKNNLANDFICLSNFGELRV